MNKLLVLVFSLVFLFLQSSPVQASSGLLYFESQGLVGYSTAEKHLIYHSQHPNDVMQENSIGFDYIQKISSETGDIGTLALQPRLSYDDAMKKAQFQVYNAYMKFKTAPGDIWVGHNRIAFGLASYWDTHAQLLQPLSMYGFGLDRDWGLGFSRDTEDGTIQVSLSSGAGMPISFNGNWLAAARVSKGVLNYDNYSLGFDVMGGRVLPVMGYMIQSYIPQALFLFGTDLALNHNNIEHKAEFNIGEKGNHLSLAAFYRIGFNFLDEDRLKLEAQATYTRQMEQDNNSIAGGITYKLSSVFTTRFMYEHEKDTSDNRYVFQLYYYAGGIL